MRGFIIALLALVAFDLAAAAEVETVRGPVRAHVRTSPGTVTVGDLFTLELEVVSPDAVEVWMPEFGQSLDRFPIVDFAASERIDEAGEVHRTQRYTLQAVRSGKRSIPSLSIEFVDRRLGERPAPEGEDAYELLTDPLSLEIATAIASGETRVLAPMRDALDPDPAGKLPAGWIAISIVVTGIAAWFALRALARMQARGRRQSAWAVARERLERLRRRGHPAPDAMDPYFVELSDIVRRYLEDRFDLRSPELTTEEFLDVAARSPDLDPSLQDLLREFLRSADMVKFARHVPSPEDVEAALSRADRFLIETRGAEAEGAA